MNGISVVIIAKDCARSIQKTLESLTWCDEIVVIDDFSTDATAAIAKRYHARVFTRHLNGDFAKQRNFGMQKALHPWVLFVDADEVVPEALRRELQKTLATVGPEVGALSMCRRDYFLGREFRHGTIPAVFHVRVLRKGLARWEIPFLERVSCHGTVVHLQHRLVHNRTETVGGYVDKANFYSSLAAAQAFERHEHMSLQKLLYDPMYRFFSNYLFSGSFVDGIHTLIFWVLISFMEFLIQAKLWLLWENERSKRV